MSRKRRRSEPLIDIQTGLKQLMASFPKRGQCLECGTKKDLVKNLTYNGGDICRKCWHEASERLGPIGGTKDAWTDKDLLARVVGSRRTTPMSDDEAKEWAERLSKDFT